MYKKNNIFLIRVCVDAALCVLMVFLPWWATPLLLLGCLVVFNNYIEIIFFGFIFDSLYSTNSGVFMSLFTLISTVLYIGEIIIKDKLRI